MSKTPKRVPPDAVPKELEPFIDAMARLLVADYLRGQQQVSEKKHSKSRSERTDVKRLKRGKTCSTSKSSH
jgi:hypothetical protein